MKRKITEALPLKETLGKLSPSAVLSAAFYSVFSFIAAAGSITEGAYPFALSLTAAARGFPLAAAAAVGGILGSLRIGGGGSYSILIFALLIARMVLGRWLASEKEDGVKQKTIRRQTPRGENGSDLTGRLLTAASEYMKESIRVSCRETLPVRMALSAVGVMIAGILYSRSLGYSYWALVGTVLSSALSPVLVWLYACAERRGKGEKEQLVADAGRIALAATAVLSLRGTGTLLFDFGVALAFAVTLLASRSRGMLIGCLYGVVCGAVLNPAYALLYAIAGVTSGLLWKISEVLAVTASCAVGIFWSVYATGLGAMSALVPELIVTSAIVAPVCCSGILPPPAVPSAGASYRRAALFPSASGQSRVRELENDAAMLIIKAEDRGRRIRELSDGMTEISQAIREMSDRLATPDDGELEEICTASFEKYCSRCGMRCACFEKDGRMMTDMQRRMISGLREDGHVSAAAVPTSLARRCYNMGHIIDEISSLFSKKRAEAKLYDRTEVVASDYEVMADMLRESARYDTGEYRCDTTLTDALRRHITTAASAGAKDAFRTAQVAVFGERVKRVVARGVNVNSGSPGADEICALFSEGLGLELTVPEFELDGRDVIMKMHCREELSVRCGRASVAMSALESGVILERKAYDQETRIFERNNSGRGFGKTAEENCGDVITAFRTDDGRFFMLICDGMGTGREASLTAGVCVMFLEKLLTAGASMETALKMLNSMMRVRKNECSATVDLMEIDLMNGHTRFVKSGAAPSFVLRDGRLFRLQSKTVPIGIVRALDAEMIRFDICKGDTVVMLSDGVVRSFEDCPWLYDMLCDPAMTGSDPGETARRIIGCAVKNGAKDDITAGVVRITDNM